jgi:uncharacterized protein involved in exopolysaccharide biosynthesis
MSATNDNTNHSSASDISELPASSDVVIGLLHWLRIASYRRNTIIASLFITGTIGAIYYITAPRYYQSTAKLLIIQRSNDQLAMVGEQQTLDNTMATHQELVTSPVVIQGALDQLLPEHRVDLQTTPPQFWNEALARNLSASTSRSSFRA